MPRCTSASSLAPHRDKVEQCPFDALEVKHQLVFRENQHVRPIRRKDCEPEFDAVRLLLRTAAGQSEQESVEEPAVERSTQRAEDGGGWRVVQTIFVQSAVEAGEVDDRVIGEVRPKSETFYVRLANMGEDADTAAISWDVGRYTGFRPGTSASRAEYQRGPRPSVEGTAVQIQGTEIGIWIDSDHPRPAKGALLPVCPAYWWWDMNKAPRPFQQPGHELSFSFDLQVPTAERQGQAEVYICAYFLLRDQRSGRQLWLGASVFDLRGADRFPDTVHVDNWEAGTGLPILFTALNERSAWLHPGPGSACFTDSLFDQYRRFEFRVGQKELQAAIAAMKNRWPRFADVSEDPRDYQLIHFNVNPEVYAPSGSRGRLGLALRDIRVSLLAPSVQHAPDGE